MGWWDQFIKVVGKLLADVGKVLLWKAVEALRKKVIDWWKGKKLAVIGPTAVGKNSFYHRLKGEDVPEKHQQTRGVERIPPFAVKHTLPDGRVFKIHVKRSVNIGGETDQRE